MRRRSCALTSIAIAAYMSAACGGTASAPPATRNVVVTAPEPVETTAPRPEQPTAPPENELPPWLVFDQPTRRIVTSTSISVLAGPRFIGATATIDPASFPVLDALATTLAANANIKRVEVRAFGNGAPLAARQEIADARAAALVDDLVDRGVPRDRLTAAGAPHGAERDGEPTFVILERE